MTDPFEERRFGKVRVCSPVARDASLMTALLANFIPLRVEYLFELDAFEYTGYSPHLRPVAPGGEVPAYSAIFHKPARSAAAFVRFE